nr:MAG TPA: hypothetical protein [Caudoviricetes sp.]
MVVNHSSYCSSTKGIDMKNRTNNKADQLTNELIRLKLLNKNKKKRTKIIPFGDNSISCLPVYHLTSKRFDSFL